MKTLELESLEIQCSPLKVNYLGPEKSSLYPRFTLTVMAKIGKNARSSEKLLELATLVHIEQWIIMSVQNERRGIIFF